MTREEASIKIGELVVYARTQGWDDEYTEAFKVLEQEPILDETFKDIEIVTTIDSIAHLRNVEEYYCTEKMFYVKEKSGLAHYYNLDEISQIHITESEEV